MKDRRSIIMKEKTVSILTVDTIPGRNYDFLGCVTSSCCLSKSIIQDVSSNIRNWTVGGELKHYKAMIDQSVILVMDRIADEASRRGADMVIGFRLSTTSVSTGAAEIIGYGTAIRFIPG